MPSSRARLLCPRRARRKGIDFYHTGDVPLNAVYNTITVSESSELGAITFVVIGALLLFFFRSPVGLIGPLAVVVLSVVITVAVLGLVGWELDLMFSMLPTLLVAVRKWIRNAIPSARATRSSSRRVFSLGRSPRPRAVSALAPRALY